MRITWQNLTQLEAEFGKKLLCRHQKNIFKRWWCYFYHGFIPHEHNHHWPHFLRPKALLSYSFILITTKLLVTGLLFITFPNPAALSEEIISRLYNLTNLTRGEYNLPLLTQNKYLNNAAELKVKDMAEKKYFSHYTPEGYAPWHFIDNVNYNYDVAGENLGMNFTRAETVHNAFLASPGHRDNILDPRFKDIGIASQPTDINNRPTQLLVVFFGQPHKIAASKTQTADNIFDKKNELLATESKSVTEINVTSTVVEGAILPADKFQYTEELLVLAESQVKETPIAKIYNWSHLLFIFFLIFLIISFIINLIVKIHIQHGQLLLQSALVICLAFGLFYLRLHFLENVNLELNIL